MFGKNSLGTCLCQTWELNEVSCLGDWEKRLEHPALGDSQPGGASRGRPSLHQPQVHSSLDHQFPTLGDSYFHFNTRFIFISHEVLRLNLTTIRNHVVNPTHGIFIRHGTFPLSCWALP
jgi:hypothetical protein